MTAVAALLEARGVTKIFDEVIANASVDFDINAGEVHALLGENGAGKSTLMNILGGILAPTAGEVLVRGTTIRFRSPRDALERGIGIVHQHFRLIEKMTVAENLFVGWDAVPKIVSRRVLEEAALELSQRFEIEVPVGAPVATLSLGAQQRVAILRTLARGADVLILDEPTSVLTPQQSEELCQNMRSLCDQGKGVVFITHKLPEVISVADRVSVLRSGRKVATLNIAAATEEGLARLMVGSEVPPVAYEPLPPGGELLRVEKLRARDYRGAERLSGVTFNISEGEIVGIAGVAGNGQSELAEIVAGVRTPDSGRILLAGDDLAGTSVQKRAAAGIGHIPEDRNGSGIVRGESIWRSAVLKDYKRPPLSWGPFVRRRAARRLASDICRSVRLSTDDIDAKIDTLSGGNAQRVVVGRELRSATKLVIAVHPSQGLDVNATRDVHQALLAGRRAGMATILVSEDLDELVILSDRILVMHSGEVVAEFDRNAYSREKIGLAMTGGRRRESWAAE